MTPEFHRPLVLDRIPAGGLEITIEATAGECAALATRMAIPAIASLSCAFHLTRLSRETVLARAVLRARLTQTCVVSLEDFEAPLQEAFQIRFVPAGTESADIDPEADDELPFAGNSIDLGEAAAEQLALALDPYPRMADVELPAIDDDPDPHPFAALRRLN